MRMHIHVGVKSIEESVHFYNALFGATPVKEKPDYAKWMLDDPAINFAISTRSESTGVDHLGIQAADQEEMTLIRSRIQSADIGAYDEGETTCCYAKSDKSWVQDPSGVAWETFETMEDFSLYAADVESSNDACCDAESKGQPGCCVPSKKTVGGCG